MLVAAAGSKHATMHSVRTRVWFFGWEGKMDVCPCQSIPKYGVETTPSIRPGPLWSSDKLVSLSGLSGSGSSRLSALSVAWVGK